MNRRTDSSTSQHLADLADQRLSGRPVPPSETPGPEAQAVRLGALVERLARARPGAPPDPGMHDRLRDRLANAWRTKRGRGADRPGLRQASQRVFRVYAFGLAAVVFLLAILGLWLLPSGSPGLPATAQAPAGGILLAVALLLLAIGLFLFWSRRKPK